ncbi:MAG TPA: B-box zinc finger protein [Terriglobales bacterium]|nr:B-box zinc finger protein [Terriglobales bacterium]
MNCQFHPDRPATAYCRTCGRPLCADDQRDIYGVIYCQECLAHPYGQPAAAGAAAGTAQPPVAPAYVPAAHAASPGLALVLGFIPGVGAVYNGQYFKAFVQVVVFAFLIAMTDSGGDAAGTFFGLAIAAFYFYMVIDSYRTAKQMREGVPVQDFFALGSSSQQFNAPVAAIVLIVIGGIFLLRSLGFFYYDFSRFLWPGALIGIGVILLLRHRGTPAS